MYRDLAIETYGDRCEICNYGLVEVHHIDYITHRDIENELRDLTRKGLDTTELLTKANELGFLKWSGNQLSKDDRITNLSVLCPNCHGLIHKLDAGIKLLEVLPPRK